MVIISAAVCDKQGDILIARQYQNITKHQLEENMRNFPKLITPDQQHTFVETEYVRYVYLPLDNMYLVLLTKKNSNIIEDQETIRLLHKIVQDLCPSGVSEQNVLKRDFDILLCFDDVISFGFRESVSLSQVQSALEMESADEKFHIMLMKQKQAEQQEAAKRHQQEMQKKRAAGISSSGNSISSSSYGSYSSSGASTNATGGISSSGITSMGSNSFKSKNDEDEGVFRPDDKPVYNPSSKATTVAPKKGLVLGKKKAPTKETPVANQKEASSSSANTQATLQEKIVQENSKKEEIKVNPLKAPVDIEIIEKMSCQMTRDGTLNSLDINGEVFLQFYDPSKARIAIQFEYENLKLKTLKPHVNLNKQLWTDKKQIALKNIETAFPVNTRIPSVKYGYNSTNTADLPFTLTCWFNDGQVALEVEFNTDQNRFEKLEKIEISFSYPSKEKPDVSSSENAEYEVNSSNSVFKYIIPSLSASNATSNIQISFSSSLAEDDIFPFDVNFTLPYTFYQIKPLAVANLGNNNELLKFDVISKCTADKYQIN
ncbi:adaptor complexes medium subunit family protein (macronuclear) [Tetrahymena thermophila SB210]|uniref:Coatomer subunit delta n=1 Tax=Tetrahymena thermophila (strain SB210) TaxID=312017 RepID=I7MMG9_TETTS|nr:adaptor complexes medium subunit family protein [Tetrahymena thermophila SB210]EAS04835.1 adaptor complexes medium subunit family protein [Tetrahymena thermophila SB210]|eukprot:XP_001025080.1 adaptor complexes medium subunit family protein [Tetrahymena thermophila SB210]